MFGEGGLVKTLTTRLLNKALEAEMDHHLGYKKNSVAGKIAATAGTDIRRRRC